MNWGAYTDLMYLSKCGHYYYIIATVIAYLMNCIFNIMFLPYPLLLYMYNLLYALFSGSSIHNHRQLQAMLVHVHVPTWQCMHLYYYLQHTVTVYRFHYFAPTCASYLETPLPEFT